VTRFLGALFILIVSLCVEAQSHEVRPAFLDMRETAAGSFQVLWKVPAMGQGRLPLALRFPENCRDEIAPTSLAEDNYVISRSAVVCEGGLTGRSIGVDGLRTTLTDVLARVEYMDGTSEVSRLTPEQPSFVVTGVRSWQETGLTYFWLGVDHILSGFDHLLFVFALLLLISNRWALVKTITAFTVAHSITLTGATLGYLSLPQKPVEAVIALSIAFVASELAKKKRDENRLSERYPWLVAFVFGLLHGFGFAGALKETGLPQVDVPLALLTFNLGVEAGQLAFVVATIVMWKLLSAIVTVPLALSRTAAAYAIGTIAAFWLLERLSGFAA
jgi:hydrogenase/urease accessory protein HupE